MLIFRILLFIGLTFSLISCDSGGGANSTAETTTTPPPVVDVIKIACAFAGEYGIENISNDPQVPSVRFEVQAFQPCMVNLENLAGHSALVKIDNADGSFVHLFDTSGDSQGNDVGKISMKGAVTSSDISMQVCALDFDVCMPVMGQRLTP